jgi:citrate synthase
MVKHMIDDIKNHVDVTNEIDIENYINKILNKEAGDGSGLLYGIGHAVYTLSDPRAEILKKCAQKLAIIKGKEKDYEFMCVLEKLAKKCVFKTKHKIVCTNVDFWSGFVYDMLGIPEVLYTPLFAMARVVGWCAHRNEELLFEGARIIRPAYKYTKIR